MKFKIKDMCRQISSGGTPSRKNKKYYKNGKIKWLKTQELNDRNIYDTEEKITEVGLQKSSAKLMPPYTVTIAMYGATVGKLGILKEEMATNQACCNMVVDPVKADYRFLFYSLLYNRHKLVGLANGAAQQNLNKKIISEFPVDYYPLVEQKRIVSILSSLDDKIELNHHINQDLEEMAQAIFKSWFVDFEPFRDGEFVDSELGPVPKGWEVDKIGNICTVTGGGTPKTKISDYWENGDILWATPSDMTSQNSLVIFDTSRKITELGLQNSSAKLLPKGSVLMTSRATIGYTSITMKEISTNQGFINIVCDKQISNYYMLCFLHYFKDKIIQLANGSTFMEVSKRNFKDIDIVVPPYNLIEKFNQYIEPIIETIYQHEQQNQILSNLRDTLLPKLMSGEIRV